MKPNSLFCPIRQIWVAKLPEEIIRQALICHMVQRLGYPLGNLALEKSLNQLPHLRAKFSLPKRRADLIVFSKDLHPQYPIYPLLLIECKAISLTNKVLRQIIGYNQFVGAYFIAAVNATQVYWGYYHSSLQDFHFQEGFPSYEQLLYLIFSSKRPESKNVDEI